MLDSQKLALYLEFSNNALGHCTEQEREYIIEAVKNHERLKQIEDKYLNMIMNHRN